MHKSPNSPLRVALLPDTFDEPNGVATLSRSLAQFARSHCLPFTVIRGGHQTTLTQDGSLEILDLKRGPAAFALDKNLQCDPFLTRHKAVVLEHLARFKPDLVHITGPGDLGFLGLWVAYILRIPLVASWHTNLHQYLSRRLELAFHAVPAKLRIRGSCALEKRSLLGLLRFYRTAHFTLAPNEDMVNLLRSSTGRPSFLIPHGVDLTTYCPGQNGQNGNRPFCIGYVGRLTAEKSVRSFVELERKLLAAGERNYKFLIVGEGGQREWLRRHLQRAEIPGVLKGNDLADAYRRMNAFVFPSQTDTFGLVILEAMASGVPVILRPDTGAVVGVVDGISGYLAEDPLASLRLLMHNCALRQSMSYAARNFAINKSWDSLFVELYQTYDKGLSIEDNRRAQKEAKR